MANNSDFVASTPQAIIFSRVVQFHRQQAIQIIDESHPYYHLEGKIINISKPWNKVLVRISAPQKRISSLEVGFPLEVWLSPNQVGIMVKSSL